MIIPGRAVRAAAASLARRRLSTKPSPSTVAQFLEWTPNEADGTAAREVVVNGYVRAVRRSKASQFVDIGDGSTRRPLQAVVPRDLADGLRVGAAVRLHGDLVQSRGKEQDLELQVDKVDVLGPSDAGTYPIQNKYQSPEYLRTIPHLRSRLPAPAGLLRLRSEALAALTQFFAGEGFVQTHPPIMTSSDCEGAGEVFTVAADAAETPDAFFRGPKYLTVSSQLHLEALAQSVGHVWTLSPTFRAEPSDTSRHLSEFYMLEAEMTFVEDMGAVMDLLENMLRFLTGRLATSRAGQELLDSQEAHLRRRWEGMQGPQLVGASAKRWPRITYSEAVEMLQAEAHRFEHKPVWGEGLQSEHEKFLASTVGGAASADGASPSPVFVTNYPRDIKAFYMLPSSTPSRPSVDGQGGGETVDCFDLLVPDLCEIAGGSMREHRLDALLAAMDRRGMVTRRAADPKAAGRGSSTEDGDALSAGSLDWYVDLRRWGSPPHGGFGLGFDRLLAYLGGVHSVRDVVAFPRWFGRCDC